MTIKAVVEGVSLNKLEVNILDLSFTKIWEGKVSEINRRVKINILKILSIRVSN